MQFHYEKFIFWENKVIIPDRYFFSLRDSNWTFTAYNGLVWTPSPSFSCHILCSVSALSLGWCACVNAARSKGHADFGFAIFERAKGCSELFWQDNWGYLLLVLNSVPFKRVKNLCVKWYKQNQGGTKFSGFKEDRLINFVPTQLDYKYPGEKTIPAD